MKATYVQRGEYIDIVPESKVNAGDVVVQGDLVGVSTKGAGNIEAGKLGAIATTGVYDVEKGNEAFAAGAKAYWDGGKATATAEGNTRIGLAVQATDASSPTVRILLNA